MPDRFTWLTIACALCVLNVRWCRASDQEHIHIKVQMPEYVRKPMHHFRNNYLLHNLSPHQHRHYYKSQPYSNLLSLHPNKAVRHKKKAIKSNIRPNQPLSPSLNSPRPSLHFMTHNNLGGISGETFDHQNMLYMPLKSPVMFKTSDDNENSSTNFLNLPSSSQKLMQHMELMRALAKAAVEVGRKEEDYENGGGSEDNETISSSPNHFLAQLLQHTFAAGKYSVPVYFRHKKEEHRGVGVGELSDESDRTGAFFLNLPQVGEHSYGNQQQMLRQQPLLQQYHQQQFDDVNYISPHQPKPLASIHRPSQNSNNNNAIYDKGSSSYGIESPPIANHNEDADVEDANDNDMDDNKDENENDEGFSVHDLALLFSGKPKYPIAADVYLPSSSTDSYNSFAVDYEGDSVDYRRQNGYKINSKNYNYEAANPFSYGSTIAFGANVKRQSAAAATVPNPLLSHLKLQRRYRQLLQKREKQKHTQYQYNTFKPPTGFSGHQHIQLHFPLQHHPQSQQQVHQQLITTAQPINVADPTAVSQFDELQQHQQLKYSALDLPQRYNTMRHKNRIKANQNQDRISVPQ